MADGIVFPEGLQDELRCLNIGDRDGYGSVDSGGNVDSEASASVVMLTMFVVLVVLVVLVMFAMLVVSRVFTLVIMVVLLSLLVLGMVLIVLVLVRMVLLVFVIAVMLLLVLTQRESRISGVDPAVKNERSCVVRSRLARELFISPAGHTAAIRVNNHGDSLNSIESMTYVLGYKVVIRRHPVFKLLMPPSVRAMSSMSMSPFQLVTVGQTRKDV